MRADKLVFGTLDAEALRQERAWFTDRCQESREAGAADMKAKILAIAKRQREQAAENVRKNRGSRDVENNASDEGALIQAANMVAAIEEL